jgi:predicted MFS family arabinose efflux permease
MYTEKKAGESIKNAAQGLFTFATYGVGMFIGTWYSGFVVDQHKATVGHDWTTIWLYPAAIAGAVLIAFIFGFNEKKEIATA